MAPPAKRLNGISPDDMKSIVLVKVDRVFPLTDVDYYQHKSGYPNTVLYMDIIVFDDEGERMLMRLVGDHIIDRFCNQLVEGRIYKVHNFLVRSGGAGVHHKYHIMLLPSTAVTEFAADAPEHGFRLMDVAALRREFSASDRLRDVIGLLVKKGEFQWKRVRGQLTRCWSFVVEDVYWQTMTVELQGESATQAWYEFQSFSSMQTLVVIVQYGLVHKEGVEVSMKNYVSATRVYWNPTFKEILESRNRLLAGVRSSSIEGP